MSELVEKVKRFTDLILSSSSAVALTGAGISTESGIPDYRSPGTGLWERMDPSVVSLDGFFRDPTRYYSFALELYPVRRAAKPNPAHYLLAELEAKGLLKGVITQNVDGLHQDAGSDKVYELHGTYRQVSCLDCSSSSNMDDAMERVQSGENPPLCKQCGGVLKPKAVFFGEMLPQVPWHKSLNLTQQSDLFIVVGSSLQVSPANILPDVALRAGAKLVIINLMPTPFDGDANLLINCKIGEFASLALQVIESSTLS